MLASGADGNQGNSSTTPLCAALQHGHLSIVDMLLKKKMKTDTNKGRERDGTTPLLIALSKKYLGIAQRLLKRGAGS